MTDRPVLMSAPMVRALLVGRKTQTRRIPTPAWLKVAAGDRLWVRETWYPRPVPPGGALYRADGTAPPGISWRSPLHMPREMSRLTLVVTATRIEPLQSITEEDGRAEGVEIPRDEHGMPVIPETSPTPLDYVEPNPNSLERIRAASHYQPHYACFWDQLHGHRGGRRWADNPEVVVVLFEVERKA